MSDDDHQVPPLLEDVLPLVHKWLEEEHEPWEIAYSMCYLAADLALKTGKSDVVVVTALLNGICAAICDHKEQEALAAKESSNVLELPINSAVH